MESSSWRSRRSRRPFWPLLRYFQSAHTFSFCRETLADAFRAAKLSPLQVDETVAASGGWILPRPIVRLSGPLRLRVGS